MFIGFTCAATRRISGKNGRVPGTASVLPLTHGKQHCTAQSAFMIRSLHCLPGLTCSLAVLASYTLQHETFWQVCPTGSLPSSLPLFAQVVCLGLTARQYCRPSLPLRLHPPLPLKLPLNLKQDQEQQIAKV